MMMGPVKGFSGDAHFFEETLNMDRIQKLLDNKTGSAGISEKLEAMKSLLAMMSKGQDVSAAFADVVKNVVVSSVEVKKLVYMYLVHYADADAQCRELALLSINSFQKDLADANPLIRALALRVLTSIRVIDILQIQLIALRKCATDVSPYVRKCAANAIPKLFSLDQSRDIYDQLTEIIGQLLNDTSTMVLGSALQAFHDVCPDRFALLHPCYRKICHLLPDLDEWGQTTALTVLMRYVRSEFTDPTENGETMVGKSAFPSRRKKKKGFYASSDEEDDDHDYSLPSRGSVFTSESAASAGIHADLDEDHRLVLKTSLPLLKSRNSAVVLAVATLHYYCGTHTPASSTLIGKSLVRIMKNQREIQYVVLSVISSMANRRPEMFRAFLQDFFIQDQDPGYTRRIKLDILTALAQDEESVLIVLKECQSYVRHLDKSFVTATIHAIGRIATNNESIAQHCLEGLMQLIHSSNDDVVIADTVVVIRQLLQTNPSSHQHIVRDLAAMLFHIDSEQARACIIWILGEFRSFESIQQIVPDALRLLVRTFAEEESCIVKTQILTLAVKLSLSNPNVGVLLDYLLELCKYDVDYDLRDRARFIQSIYNTTSDPEHLVKVLASAKPPPLLASTTMRPRFTLGSLSNVVNHAVAGYRDLPDWFNGPIEGSKRDVVAVSSSYSEDDHQQVLKSKSKSKSKLKSKADEFYSSSEEEESSSDEEESSSDEEESESSSDESDPSNAAAASYQPIDLMNQPTTFTANDFLNDFAAINLKTSRDTKDRVMMLDIPGCLSIEYCYLRQQASMYSVGMNILELILINKGPSNLTRIRMIAKHLGDGQQIVPFPEIQKLAPEETKSVQLHVDFAGDFTNPMELELKTTQRSFPLSITPSIGELLRPHTMTLMDFELTLAGLNEYSKPSTTKGQNPAAILNVATLSPTTFTAVTRYDEEPVLIRIQDENTVQIYCKQEKLGQALLTKF